MKIAVSIWKDRISPVFDASRSVELIDVDETGNEVARQTKGIDTAYPSQRVTVLMDLEVDILICGAISAPLAEMIVAAEIRLIPFVKGDLDAVLAAYRCGELPSSAFLMPGCGGGRRRRRNRGQCRRR